MPLIRGFIKDSDDDRDSIILDTNLPAASSADVDLPSMAGDKLTPVSNQRWSSSCVANGSADCLEMVNALAGHDPVEISRLHIYYNGRAIMYAKDINSGKVDEDDMPDKGLQVRCAIKSLAKLGVCQEELWPFDLNKLNKRPPFKASLRGLKNKIDGYEAIRGTGEEIHNLCKRSIQAFHPFIFAIPVTSGFAEMSGPNIVEPPKKGEEIHGYHCIIGCGNMGDKIKIRNSWGTNYRMNGYVYLHEGWFLEQHAISIWSFRKSKPLRK